MWRRLACGGHAQGAPPPKRRSPPASDRLSPHIAAPGLRPSAATKQETRESKAVAFGEGEEGIIDLWKCACRKDKRRTRKPPAACLCRTGGRSPRAIATAGVACRRLASACSPIPGRLPEARYAFLTFASQMRHRRPGKGAPLEAGGCPWLPLVPRCARECLDAA